MSCTLSDHITTDLAVVGGGIVGLGIAWEARRAGHRVVLIDPAPGTGATFAAAGMLAPVSELHHQEEDLLELTLASAQRWPAFAESLPAGSDAGSCLLSTPTLVLGADPADRQALADLCEAQHRHGLEVGRLSLREARAYEPLLSPNLAAAYLVPRDHQVDPRAVARAILDALATAPEGNHAAQGGCLVGNNAVSLLHEEPEDTHSRVTGVLLAGGREVHAKEVVVANGLGAAHLGGLPDGLRLPLRPVYGDILRLRVPENLQPLTTATLRGQVRGLPVYVVPRSDGTVVIGATSREDGSAGVSAGGVHQLLRDAQVLLPAVAELELLEATARARPGTPDNAPLLGRVADARGTDIPGLILATGFFRHGVLLTPIAAHITTELLHGRSDPAWDRFRPDRFSPALHLQEIS